MGAKVQSTDDSPGRFKALIVSGPKYRLVLETQSNMTINLRRKLLFSDSIFLKKHIEMTTIPPMVVNYS